MSDNALFKRRCSHLMYTSSKTMLLKAIARVESQTTRPGTTPSQPPQPTRSSGWTTYNQFTAHSGGAGSSVGATIQRSTSYPTIQPPRPPLTATTIQRSATYYSVQPPTTEVRYAPAHAGASIPAGYAGKINFTQPAVPTVTQSTLPERKRRRVQ